MRRRRESEPQQVLAADPPAGTPLAASSPGMVCVGNNTVAALLAGAIDPGAAQRLELHLDACGTCRQLVAELGRGLSAIGEAPREVSAQRLPRLGERVGRYAIRRVIGVGGMGVVYEAHDARLDRRVAVKVLRPDLVADGLLAEAQAMARLQHPNIVAVHDAGTFEGQLFVCMEYVAGTTLRDWLTARPRSWREVLRIFHATGRGLAYVHARGLVHLDFKPDNVLVDREGRPLVTDFGLARMTGQGHQPGLVVGTLAYMSPEQRRGERTDARGDQFAFCVALDEAIGKDAPAWVRRAIARGRAARPEDRFASMDALLHALTRERGRGLAVVLAGVAIAAAVAIPRGAPSERIVTRLVDRPIAQRLAAPATVPTSASVAPAAEPPMPIADRVTLVSAPPPREAVASLEPVATPHAPRDRDVRFLDGVAAPQQREPARLAASALTDEGPALVDRGCDDGSPRICALAEPTCPGASSVAVQRGCWTCADDATCAPLGLPHACDDGSKLTCTAKPPTCTGHEVISVRDGCYRCADPFTCGRSNHGSPAPRPTPPPPKHDHCGNGMCEAGEDHASCPSDCCEAAADGACVATCGNGFCEAGEDHAACPADCCETGASGACLPVCGNGFCEEGEDAAQCPQDCT